MSKTYKARLTGAKSVSSHCRNNNSCPYCRGNRDKLYRIRKQLAKLALE